MKIFEHRNTSGKDVCPICRKNDDKPTVLLPIIGTQKDNIAEAIQIHLECLHLTYDKENKIIYQSIE